MAEHEHHSRQESPRGSHAKPHHSYVGAVVSLAGSFVVMYLAMYAMADRFEHVYLNLSNVWMTGVMTAAMSVPMLLAMGHMLPTPRAKTVGWSVIAVMGLASWFLLRARTPVLMP